MFQPSREYAARHHPIQDSQALALGLGHGHGDLGHGHSHSRVFRAYGRCHGFDVDVSTGGWFNAGHADNLFGGTGFGRRIVPVARAARLRRYAHTLETCTLITH